MPRIHQRSVSADLGQQGSTLTSCDRASAAPTLNHAAAPVHRAPAFARTRWPAAVYGTGSDPDPRFTFSNERTLLAWIRTGLALAAAGIAVGAFVQEFSRPLRIGLASSLLVAASICSVGGLLRWMNAEQALRRKLPLPSPLLAACLAVGICALGVVGLYGIISHG